MKYHIAITTLTCCILLAASTLRGEDPPPTEREAQLLKEVKQLKNLIENLQKQNKQLKDRISELALSSLEGRITATKDSLVVVSIGSDDGVKVEQEYNIFPGGKSIGRIKIVKVGPDYSVGSIIKDITPDIPKVGNSVELKQLEINSKVRK